MKNSDKPCLSSVGLLLGTKDKNLSVLLDWIMWSLKGTGDAILGEGVESDADRDVLDQLRLSLRVLSMGLVTGKAECFGKQEHIYE